MRFTNSPVFKSLQTHATPRRPARRRFVVQGLEKRELLAGDLEFNPTSGAPYRVVEGKAVTGSIKIDSPATVALEVQITLEQATPQASLRFSAFVETKVVTIPVGETESPRFLVAAVVDNVRDGEHDVVLKASLAG
ncbi:MAG: hypothetical protein ACR2OA_13420 [Rubripirellula sp.]|jgi:hypothetical protein